MVWSIPDIYTMWKLLWRSTSNWDSDRWIRWLRQNDEMFGTGAYVRGSSEANEAHPRDQVA